MRPVKRALPIDFARHDGLQRYVVVFLLFLLEPVLTGDSLRHAATEQSRAGNLTSQK